MNKPNLSKISRNLRMVLSKNSPDILIGIGITGMITTTIMAVRATPKACRLIENAKYVRAISEDKDGVIRDFTAIDYVKTAGYCYIPSVITGCLSIACFLGARSVNLRRNTALATAYTLSESALREYKQKVIQTIGEKKEEAIRDSIAKDKIDRDPVSNREVFITDKGDTLCYDPISGRYFETDIDKLRKAENDLNRRMRDEMFISLNDFYYEIGLKTTSKGDDLGWNIDKGYIELKFSSQLSDDGRPCLVVDYLVAPIYEYNKWL